MAIITFISDFGDTDHYAAAVKARILSENPMQIIVDISHKIEHFNVAHGSFVLRSVFRDFPEGTVHLVGVHSNGNIGDPYIAIKLENHYFIGADNGLLSLLSDQDPEEIILLGDTEESKNLIRSTTFPARDIFAPAAVKLASGIPLTSLGEPTKYFNRMLPVKPRASKKQISGHVIHIDHYGNLVTNIQRSEFEFLLEDKFFIKIGREQLHKIHKSYNLVDPGDIFAVFNSQDLLEIGINNGNASELLGLSYNSPIAVNFISEDSKQNSSIPPLSKTETR